MPIKIRSRSSDSYIEKLPRDNSSKSLLASIEDVSRNLKYADNESDINVSRLYFKKILVRT